MGVRCSRFKILNTLMKTIFTFILSQPTRKVDWSTNLWLCPRWVTLQPWTPLQGRSYNWAGAAHPSAGKQKQVHQQSLHTKHLVYFLWGKKKVQRTQGRPSLWLSPWRDEKWLTNSPIIHIKYSFTSSGFHIGFLPEKFCTAFTSIYLAS